MSTRQESATVWDARWAVFWYNDAEILDWQPADFLPRAEKMASEGVTHVFTFSCTHFRWSFHREWPRLVETARRVVEACHAHGIKVVEHHSAILAHVTNEPAAVESLKNCQKMRQSSVDRWPCLAREHLVDARIEGVPVADMLQLDGRTGKPATTNWNTWSFCFNHPVHRKVYLAHLADLYRAGVDGIMTDDVQFFSSFPGHSCACGTCRREFKERYGHELPAAGEAWTRWHGNFEDPSYTAWLDFRLRSAERFHAAVKAHYDGLGVSLIRPNYAAKALYHNWSAYTLDTLPQVDWVSIEFCFSHTIRHSWPDYAIEAAHRFALARHRGVPAGAIIYPDGADTVRLSWALTKSWGMVWQPTHEGGTQPLDGQEEEARLRGFESRHAAWFSRPENFASLGIYVSRSDRDFYGGPFGGYNMRSRTLLTGWALACIRQNLPFDCCVEDELGSRLGAYRALVLPEAAILDDAAIARLRRFAEEGGTLVWLGKSGARASRDAARPEAELARLLGIPGFRPAGDEEVPREWKLGKGRVTTCGYNAVPAGLLFRPEHREDPVFFTVCSTRYGREDKGEVFGHDVAAHREYYRRVVALLRELGVRADLEAEGLPDDVLATAFRPAAVEGLAIHVVNAAGTWDVPPKEVVRHSDPVPFPPLPPGGPVLLRVRKPESLRGIVLGRAELLDPDRENPLALDCRDDGARVEVRVPRVAIRRSCLVCVSSRS